MMRYEIIKINQNNLIKTAIKNKNIRTFEFEVFPMTWGQTNTEIVFDNVVYAQISKDGSIKAFSSKIPHSDFLRALADKIDNVNLELKERNV